MDRHVLELSKVVSRKHISDMAISSVKVRVDPECICCQVMRGGNKTSDGFAVEMWRTQLFRYT